MDYPALAQLPKIISQLRAADPNAPAATTYYTPQNSGDYDSTTLGQLDDLRNLINTSLPLPESVTSTAFNPKQALGDDYGSGDYKSQALLTNAARNAWANSDVGQANKAALDAYYATPAGQARQQLEAFQQQANMASEDKASSGGGWLEQRLDDTADFWDQYGTPIVAALMTAGIGSAVAGAAGASGVAGSVGATSPEAVGAINGAIGGATAGGALSAVTGQNVGQGILAGGLTGGIGGGLSGYNPAAQMGITDPTVASAVNGAIKGGVNAELTGGNVGQGIIGGGLKGGASTVGIGSLLGGDSGPTLSSSDLVSVDQSGPDSIQPLPQQPDINIPSLAGFIPGGDNTSSAMDEGFDWQSILQDSLDQGVSQNNDYLTQLQNEINNQVQSELPDWATGTTPTGTDPYFNVGSSGIGGIGGALGALSGAVSKLGGSMSGGSGGASGYAPGGIGPMGYVQPQVAHVGGGKLLNLLPQLQQMHLSPLARLTAYRNGGSVHEEDEEHPEKIPGVPLFRTGGQGKYVQGPGTGQSDDIPAMLADGEYVFDADTVSALGDGSNKAGAELLDRLREQIRAHKRSAPANKIPPKAKTPLEYLKKARS